jgi:hypothetical protein
MSVGKGNTWVDDVPTGKMQLRRGRCAFERWSDVAAAGIRQLRFGGKIRCFFNTRKYALFF